MTKPLSDGCEQYLERSRDDEFMQQIIATQERRKLYSAMNQSEKLNANRYARAVSWLAISLVVILCMALAAVLYWGLR